jgi:hypothetical protein
MHGRDTGMGYVVIQRYQMVPGAVGQVNREMHVWLLPEISNVPGFERYYIVLAEDDVLATVGVFEDRAGAEKSIKVAAKHVRQHDVNSYLPTPPETVIAGEIWNRI